MPLCVVGKPSKAFQQLQDPSVKAIQQNKGLGTNVKFGRRPKHLVKYRTVPGVDNCYSIVTKANPPLSRMQFVELNPQISCMDMETESLKIFLPEGTVVPNDEESAERIPTTKKTYDKDCVMGPWSEWSSCEDNKRTRNRNVYQDMSGNGEVCSDMTEASSCKSNGDKIPSFLQASTDQCLKAADGCSTPVGLTRLSAVFVPACNYHDVCWACRGRWGWKTEQECNDVWYRYMLNTCEEYWRNPFDKAFCRFEAYWMWWIVHHFGSPSYDYPGTCPSHDETTNVQLGGRNIGYAVPEHCECEGGSCDYRGEPYPCWGDGSICGAGTTCNNCCNAYSWWDSKFFTACGSEPCWSRGTICGAGTTCNNCCNGYSWWWSKFFTVCN